MLFAYSLKYESIVIMMSFISVFVQGDLTALLESFGLFLTRINRKSFALPSGFKYNKEKPWRMCSCYLRINMLTRFMVQ